VEQRLRTNASGHHASDIRGAIAVQRELAAYYRDHGDDARAKAADERAEAGTKALPSDHQAGTFSGTYRAADGEFWQFRTDGTFGHTTIFKSGTFYRRDFEKGRFALAGEKLELRMAGTDAGAAPRVMKIQLKGADGQDGIVLDGVTFNRGGGE
jgi:hypothetical protein